MPTPATARALAALLVVLALLLSACSGSEERKVDTDGDGRPDTPAAEATTTAPPPPDPSFGLPTVGQCHRLTPRESKAAITTSPAVPCRQRHTSVVAYAALVDQPITEQTPLPRRTQVAQRVCPPAFRATVGGTPNSRALTLLTWTFFTPSAEQLERGARWVRCDVVARSGNALAPLPARTPLLGRAAPPEDVRVCQNARGLDVSCTRNHLYRVTAVFRARQPAYPGPAFTETARTRCAEVTGKPGGFFQLPSKQGWATGDRFVRCLDRRG